jgi:hypothetical protein
MQTSGMGLLATSLYMGLYTWPRRQELVLERMAAKGLTTGDVLKLYALFGGE